jgi:hypothetical protein
VNDQHELWVEVSESDPELAEEIQLWLKEQGASSIERSQPKGFDVVVLPIVITAIIIGAGGVSSFLSWLRRHRRCLLIVDARGETIRTSVDCSDRTGRTLIVGPDGVHVELKEAPEMLDLNALAQAAVKQGAEAAAKLAAEAGAGTCRERPVALHSSHACERSRDVVHADRTPPPARDRRGVPRGVGARALAPPDGPRLPPAQRG